MNPPAADVGFVWSRHTYTYMLGTSMVSNELLNQLKTAGQLEPLFAIRYLLLSTDFSAIRNIGLNILKPYFLCILNLVPSQQLTGCS